MSAESVDTSVGTVAVVDHAFVDIVTSTIIVVQSVASLTFAMMSWPVENAPEKRETTFY